MRWHLFGQSDRVVLGLLQCSYWSWLQFGKAQTSKRYIHPIQHATHGSQRVAATGTTLSSMATHVPWRVLRHLERDQDTMGY